MKLRHILSILLCAASLTVAAQSGCNSLSMPFSEDFDNHSTYATLPPCWVASRNYDLGPIPSLNASQHHSGSRSLMLYSGSIPSSHYSIAISPELNVSSFDDLFLRLYLYASSTATRLEVGICVDTGRYTRQFTPIDTLQVLRPNRWQELVVDLSRYTGAGRRLAFRLQRSLQGTNSQCFIDDLRIGPCGTTVPTVSHLGARSLTLDWETYGNGIVTLEYNGISIVDATPPINITGLTPSTSYTFTLGCDGGVPQQITTTTLEGPSLVPAWYEPFGTSYHSLSDSTLYILPLQESLPTSALHMALRLRASNAARLVVGAMTYPGENESFESIDTIEATTLWQRHTVNLGTYRGSGGYIAMRALGAIQIDDLRVARCLIDSLHLYNLTENSITLDWQYLTDSTDIFLEYGPPGFAPGSGTLLTANTHPYTLTSLSPSTPYDVLAYPACGDLPCSYDRHSFTTFAHSVSVPYCTGFEGGAIPLGWVSPSGGTSLGNTSYQGTRCLQLEAGSIITLPLIDVPTGDSLWLEFYGLGADTLTVGTMATPYSTFTPLANYTGNTWVRRTLGVVIPDGHLLAFRARGNWNLDAIALHHDAIASASVSNITQTTARITWTMYHGDSVLIEYKAVTSAGGDFASGTGTRLIAIDSVILTGLVSGTHYAVHLTPFSDVGSAECHYLTLRLQTSPTPLSAPYCEDFDALANNGYPTTWRRASTLGNYPLANNSRSHSSPRSLYFRAGAHGKTVALLPDIVSSSQHLTLAFWTNTSHNPVGTQLLVGHLDNINDYNTFQPVDTLDLGTLNAWKHHLINLGTSHNHIAIMLVGGSSESRIWIDDLCIEPCVANNITLSEIDSSNVKLHWQSIGAQGLIVRTTGGGSIRIDTFYTSPSILNDLDTNTVYTLQFRSLCECGGVGGAYYGGYGSTGNAATDSVTTLSIHTQPVAVPTPYCQDFNQYTSGRLPGNWFRHGSNVTTSDLNYHSASRSIAMRNNTTLVLPPINHLNQMVATLYLYSTNESAVSYGALLLGTLRSRDSLSTFIALDTLQLTHPRAWQRHYSSLIGAPSDHRYLALRFVSNDTCTLYVDDVNISPCALGEANLTPEGVGTWQGIHSPTSYAIEFGPHGFIAGSGTKDTVNGTRYAMTGITPGENYDLYLTPICDTSANCQHLILSTHNLASTPLCEHFETTTITGLPDEWVVGRTCSGSPSIVSTASNHTLLLRSTTLNESRSVAAAPLISGENDSLQVSLSMFSNNVSNARLIVGFIAADADPNTFIPIDTLFNAQNNSWQRHIIQLPPHAGRRLAFSAIALSQTCEILLDSLYITRGFTPLLSPVSARMLALKWPVNNNYIEYGPAGFTQGNGTLVHCAGQHDTLCNLTPSETYWFYTLEDNNISSCMAPISVTMPTEVDLPYCHPTTITIATQLPEINIDSIQRLHLKLTLQGSVAIGIMERNGDWQNITLLDTLVVPTGTRRTLYTSLNSYEGSGRFIGIIPLISGTIIDSLSINSCAWITAEILDNNCVLLLGNGHIEFGTQGFTMGNGTTITVTDSTIITGLQDTTTYNFYTLCNAGETPCPPLQQWRTSLHVETPYCVDFTQGIPIGWSTESDANIGQAVRLIDDCLLLNVDGNQQIGVTLPILDKDSLVVDLEVWFSSTAVALTSGSQILRAPAGSWQHVRLFTNSDRRPTLYATGNGFVKIRRVEVTSCTLPQQVAIGKLGGGHVVLNWNSVNIDTPFYIDYILDGDSASTTLEATTPPMALQLLPDTHYSLYLKCDSISNTCLAPIHITTLAPPQNLPYCLDVIRSETPNNWVEYNELSSERYLVLPLMNNDSLRQLNIMFYAQTQGNSPQTVVIGAMSDAADLTTFDSLQSFNITQHKKSCFFTFANYHGQGRFIVLRMGKAVEVDSLSVSDCAIFNLQQGETGAEHTTFSWHHQGTPTVSIEYGPTGFARGSGTFVHSTTSPLSIDGLDPLTDYTFYVSHSCGSIACRPTLVDTFFTFTPKGGVGCIDYTDLRATYVSCKYGSYDSPSEQVGAIDHGYLSAASRHTIHFDTTERDARTGGLLRTVPIGEKASVRLGNWTTGGNGAAQAESITYGMTIDSTQANLLILKYAAVLQDPEHSSDLQPRFRLEILNQNDQLIDSCGLAYFVANPNLGWNTAAGEVLWKDWTTVGLDLSAYAGQTIYVRLTTNDCGEGSHFGYAYFTLECATKRLLTEGCSDVPDNRFTAPNGFHYRWYSNQDTTTISDSASIWVRSDNTMTYYCELSFIDNPSCNFTMSAFAGARYPLALFDTAVTVADCEFTLTLTNRSTISGDGITPIGTGESCESTRWILPDGSSASSDIVAMHLTDTGLYNITLISGIAGNLCTDTLRQLIRIVRPYPDAAIIGREERCDNDTPDTFSVQNASSYTWADGGSGNRQLAPVNDTSITCYTVDFNGCRDTLSYTIHVLPTYHLMDIDSICNNMSNYLWIDTTITFEQNNGALILDRHLHTSYGQCDSIRTLHLQLMPSYNLAHYDTLCHDSRLPFFDTMLTTSGSYFHADSTTFGCDSLVTQHLTIVPRVYNTDSQVACDSLIWIDGITYRSDNSDAIDTLLTPRGCDSVVTLNLTVHYSTTEVAIDTFCDGSTYFFRNHTLQQGGYYADTLSTIHGCDSILAIELTRLDLPALTITHDYDCDSLYHHITATSDVPYLLWSAYPDDSTLLGQERNSHISVKPTETTTYTVYVDYAELPHCPSTEAITLTPATKPEVVLKVNPGALRPQHLEFDAYDLSLDYTERRWYVDWMLQGETSRHLQASATAGTDSAVVTLIVSDGHCVDTATHILYVLHHDIVAPNAFTPAQETNNRFYIISRGLSRAELRIFNRNGVIVYSSDDINQQWDGRSNSGEPCPMGNYVWHLRYSTLLQPTTYYTASGSVLLLR